METYGRLLNDDVFDVKVLNFKALRVGVRLGVLEEAGDELDRLFRPATCNNI